MNPIPISIFNYQNSHQFLLDRVRELQVKEPGLSVRALAARMQMKSHALLLMLLQGKRPLRVKHAASLAKGLGLSSHERLYLQALIQYDSATDLEEKQLCSLWISELHPTQPTQVKELEDFELVSNWLHMAILALSETEGADLSAEGIARRFGAKTNVAEVRAALQRLKTKGLIKYTDESRFEPTYQRITTADDVANEGAKKYHRSVMKIADDALGEQALDQREFQSFSIAIDPDKVALGKEMIRKFRTQFAKAVGAEPGKEVYQLSIQFFQLTESPAQKERTEDEGVASEWKQKTTKGSVQ